MFLLLSISMLINGYVDLKQENNDLLINGRCKLYEGKLYETEKNYVNGLYWIGKDYYCVWANYRTLEEQEATDRHEYCHYLVDNDYDHFCSNIQTNPYSHSYVPYYQREKINVTSILPINYSN